jgi:hypothetical protein
MRQMPHLEHARRGRRRGPIEWRREQLLDAGFPRELAARLARDVQYDLHRLIELVEFGCPPPLAVRILDPLDDPDGT